MVDHNPPASVAGRVSFTLLFLRFLLCSFAFLVAIFVAALVATFGLFRGLEGDEAYQAFFAGTAILAFFAVAASAFLPFVLVVVLAELMRWRAFWVYGLAGAAIGAYEVSQGLESVVTLSDQRILIAAASGIVGGGVYWLIAGRSAGDYRERRYAPTASAPGSPEA